MIHLDTLKRVRERKGEERRIAVCDHSVCTRINQVACFNAHRLDRTTALLDTQELHAVAGWVGDGKMHALHNDLGAKKNWPQIGTTTEEDQ